MPDNDSTKEEKEDLKEGEGQQPADTGQSEKEGDEGGEGDGDETVTIKKSELEQIKSDRDNYRDATLDKKAKERELKRTEKSEEGKSGEGTDSEGGETTTTVDETKKTEKSFEEKSRLSNQQRARKQFLTGHKEYIDDSLWNDMMSDYRSSDNDVTVEDFVDRLKETVLLHKRRTGKLDEYLASERERGRQEGRTQTQIASGQEAGGVGDKNEGGSGQPALSEKGKEMAKGMKLDPEKVAKVDPSKDNVIQV